LAAALVGTWVVIRGMTFLGDALVHGVIPGIALGLLLDFNLLLGAAVAAAVMIIGINLVHRQTAFSEDTGIGLLFVGMLGLGVILISRTPSYSGNLTSILFGDVLGVSSSDIRWLAVVAALTAACSVIFYRQFLVLSFNEQKARLLGFNPNFAHIMLLALITMTIVGSFQTVGTLLVFGLLVGPPATAALLVRRVPTMMAAAALIGLGSVVVGLLVSYHANTAGSATMAMIPVLLFFIVLSVRAARARPADG
jgi:ABC-type Mn2+/Zn2+ transport system permease subunit